MLRAQRFPSILAPAVPEPHIGKKTPKWKNPNATFLSSLYLMGPQHVLQMM